MMSFIHYIYFFHLRLAYNVFKDSGFSVNEWLMSYRYGLIQNEANVVTL